MSKYNKERVERDQKRLEDAYAAAEGGEQGWTALGSAWGISTPGAWEWGRKNLPSAICEKLAINGNASRATGGYRKCEHAYSKPAMRDPFRRVPTRIETCQRTIGKEFRVCGLPSNGKNYCEPCAKIILTGGDRKTYETLRPRQHPWIEDLKKYA